MWASGSGHARIVDFLMREAHANQQTKSKRGFTALMIASLVGHKEVVSVLLKDSRASIDKTNYRGENALMMASSKGHLPVVRLLLDEKAEIDAQSNEQRTALYYACLFAHVHVVSELLNRKAKPSLSEPLSAAFIELPAKDMKAIENDLENFWSKRAMIVRLLALHDANMEAKPDGKTMLTLAKATKQEGLINALKAGTTFFLAKKQKYLEEFIALMHDYEAMESNSTQERASERN